MNTGQYISGGGHLVLIGWMFVGGIWFPTEELPTEIANVSVISEAQFTALQDAAAPRQPDEPGVQVSTSEPGAENNQSVVPDAPETSPPPVLVEAPQEPDMPPAPPPQPQSGSTQLENEADNAMVRQADIVTDTETPEPDDTSQEQPTEPAATTLDDPTEDTQVIEAAPDVTPEDTTTEIVTEADDQAAGEGGTVTSAPTTSIRPQARPERVVASEPEPEQPTEVAEQVPSEPSENSSDPLGDLINQTLDTIDEPSDTTSDTGGTGLAADGPPLTSGEIDGFRIAVKRCWVMDPGSQAARVSVTLAFSLDQSGRLAAGPTMISNSGGDDAVVRAAYEAARRAVVRCNSEGGGFRLPPEKYNQWREVEMTFDAGAGRVE